MSRILLAVVLIAIWSSCQEVKPEGIDSCEALPDNQAGDVVKKAIAAAGGWDNWKSKDNFSFYKKITQLDSTGTVKKIVKQLHTYQLKDGFKARMEWSVGSNNFLILNDGDKAIKYKNGIEMTDKKSENEAWNSSYGSHYVIGIPYKLADPGVTLGYNGIDSTLLGKPVHSVQVEYDKGVGITGGMHRWIYYFDLDTYDLAANFQDYGDGHSLTTYEVFESVGTHTIHNKRFSYASNKDKEKVQLKTVYENEEMTFNITLDKNAFTLL